MSSADKGSSVQGTLGAIGLVLLLLAGFALLPRLFTQHEPPLVGHPAPDFTLSLVANERALGEGKKAVTLSELRGKAVVLDFWATWCQPCQAEAPILDKLAQRYRDQGLLVVGVHTSDPDGDAHAFMAAHGLSYAVVDDVNNRVAHGYSVESLPTLVVVSREGKVLAVRSGLTGDAELEKLVRKAL
jgi:thiol-disulfide isomerase/thioredoxin